MTLGLGSVGASDGGAGGIPKNEQKVIWPERERTDDGQETKVTLREHWTWEHRTFQTSSGSYSNTKLGSASDLRPQLPNFKLASVILIAFWSPRDQN